MPSPTAPDVRRPDAGKPPLKLSDPDDVASTVLPLIEGFGAPWCVAGGWALDLFLGHATRPHSDVELAVFRQDQARLHEHFDGWTFTVSVDGRREAWPRGESLELPRHEIHAYSQDEPTRSLELLLNERDGVNWIFRRNPEIVLPLERAIVRTAFGVDALSPEIALLFKAKVPRAKDEADFHATVPAMSGSQRQWLRSALLVVDPEHPWVRALDATTA